MTNADKPAPEKQKCVKVSHSLDAALAQKLKDFSYWARVSESAIIEFVLADFFSIGPDEALEEIVHAAQLSPRKMRRAHRSQTGESLGDEIDRARVEFARAFSEWRKHPCKAHFSTMSRARAHIAAVWSKVERAGQRAITDTRTNEVPLR